MKDKIEIVKNSAAGTVSADMDFMNKTEQEKVFNFHKSFPQYKKTPLQNMNHLADNLNVKGIYVKDESFRFGLNAFKVLGGSYAVGTYIAHKLGKDISELPFDIMTSSEVKKQLGELTFISATDGNHGRGVAWTAHQLGQNCVIHMPKGSSKERLENIKAEGAKADITDFNYDDTVRIASKEAEKNGWIMVQDTSWPGYEELPRAIMQGYSTIATEICEQLKEVQPTHIFLQAGVGSFASSLTACFAQHFPDKKPVISIVEPVTAACIYQTIEANDGKLHPVIGEMKTIMAGLACGEPVTVGIDILRNYADFCIKGPDSVAADGMRVLASPLSGDEKIISGESGASAFGCVYNILRHSEYEDLKNKLGITKDSVLLFISTEGDTDKENYRKVLWDGAYSRCKGENDVK